MGDHEWTFALDSLWMNFKSLKSPKVLLDKEDDPDGLFYEKAFLMEQPIWAIDMIFCILSLGFEPLPSGIPKNCQP